MLWVKIQAIDEKHFGSVGGFTMEEMTDHYIATIRSVHLHGPYVIVCYSMGDLVALVVADKLKKTGEVITHLITSIRFPAHGRQGLKSLDWTARAIGHISRNFPEIGERWKIKLLVETRRGVGSTLLRWTGCPRRSQGPGVVLKWSHQRLRNGRR